MPNEGHDRGQVNIELEETGTPLTSIFKRKKKDQQADDISMSEYKKEVQYQCLESDKTKSMSKGVWVS